MADTTAFELVYEGQEVEDGTIPIDYLIDALVGIYGAYDKVAGRTQPDVAHRIRVTGLKQSSTHIVLDVIEWIRINPAASTVIETGIIAFAAGAYKVITDIGKYIAAKKQLKGATAKGRIVFEEGEIFLLDTLGVKLPLTKEQAEMLLQGLLDSDLNKLTAPLDDGKVERFEIKHRNESVASIDKAERPYFAISERPVTSTRDHVWMDGLLNSFTKDRGRGTFHTTAGKHIPYRYVGDDDQQLLRAFAHRGLVRALSTVSFDADLNPTSMDIMRIELSQSNLF